MLPTKIPEQLIGTTEGLSESGATLERGLISLIAKPCWLIRHSQMRAMLLLEQMALDRCLNGILINYRMGCLEAHCDKGWPIWGLGSKTCPRIL